MDAAGGCGCGCGGVGMGRTCGGCGRMAGEGVVLGSFEFFLAGAVGFG